MNFIFTHDLVRIHSRRGYTGNVLNWTSSITDGEDEEQKCVK